MSKNIPKSQLEKRLESIRTATDTPTSESNLVDDHGDKTILPYFEEFLTGLRGSIELERVDLSTPEAAKRSLASIEKTRAQLDKQLKTARALQQLAKTSQFES